jgi:hypothetical protein
VFLIVTVVFSILLGRSTVSSIHRTVLFSGEEGKVYVNTNSQSGRESYAEQWLQIREKLQQITTKLGIGIISISLLIWFSTLSSAMYSACALIVVSLSCFKAAQSDARER